MDINEDVLYATLAQIENKGSKSSGQPQKKKMELIKEKETPKSKVDQLYELERKIISLLVLYGREDGEFHDILLKQNEHGEMVYESEVQEAKVFEKIFLDLQEDEIEFTNEDFKELFQLLIEKLNSEDDFGVEMIINDLEKSQAVKLTDILMEEEQYELHDWARHDIPVKKKEQGISQYVTQTILSLRRYLVGRKISELVQEMKDVDSEDNRTEMIQEIMSYTSLSTILSDRLGRVM